MVNLYHPIRHRPFKYDHPWEIHRRNVWAGAIRWGTSEKAFGWIHPEGRKLCPCQCRALDFEVFRTEHYKLVHPVAQPVRPRLPFALEDDELEDAVAKGDWNCDLVVIQFQHRMLLGELWVQFDKGPEVKGNSGRITTIAFENHEDNYAHNESLAMQSILMQHQRVAVLTFVGNPGMNSSQASFIKGKGHSALVVGNRVLNWTSGGWAPNCNVGNYFLNPENIDRTVVVQELNILTMPNLSEAIKKAKEAGIPWWPVVLPINWIALIAVACTGDYPFFIPGGTCSQRVANLLGIEEGLTPFWSTEPKDVFFEVRKKYAGNISREYYIHGYSFTLTDFQQWQCEKRIDSFLGPDYVNDHCRRLKHARPPDVRSWT